MNTINIKALSEEVQKLETKVQEAVELPTVETTDEGKVLTVNSSGKWAALDPASQLPTVTSEDEGSLLTVNSSGKWAKGNPIIGNLDYSETEQDTGVKWIDGKNVYFRVLSGITPDNDTPSIDVECPFDTIIKFYGTVGTVDFNKNISATWLATKTGVRIYKATGYLSTPFKLIAFYTKPTATREPDEEPETKKVSKKKTNK